MRYAQPVGPVGPVNPFGNDYLDKNAGAGVAGSFLPAEMPTAVQRELVELIVAAGFTPSAGDLRQVAKAVRRLGRRMQTNAVISAIINAPPGSPSLYDLYIVGPTPSGAWSGQAGNFAYWDGEGWYFHAPYPGQVVRALDTGQWFRRSNANTTWLDAYAGTTNDAAGVVALADLTTAAQQNNSVAVLTPATLPRALAGAITNQLVYTANASWSVPTGDRFSGVCVELIGGGGGGGLATSGSATPNFGGGGSNGVYLRDYFSRAELLAIASSFALTIGAGGAGRTIAAGVGSGANGGNTSFGSVLVANGGNGGGGAAGAHGAGGAGQNSATIRAGRTLQIPGQRGADGYEIAGLTFPGVYGSIGQGGQGGYDSTGGPDSNASNGAPGAVIITEIFF